MIKLRRWLQVSVALGTLVPIMAGGAGIIFGPAMLGENTGSSMSLDSHYRYLSGLLLGIGLAFLSTIPQIEKKTALFRTLALIVVMGGLARLYGLLHTGVPDRGMLFGLGMELVIVPLLALWQSVVARQSRL